MLAPNDTLKVKLIGQNDLDNAFLDFNQAVRIDPGYADAYMNRAIVYSHKGDAANALADVLKAQSLGAKVDQKIIDKLKRALEK